MTAEIPISRLGIDQAYNFMGINSDRSVADDAIITAYFQHEALDGFEISPWAESALTIIANARRSHLLHFVSVLSQTFDRNAVSGLWSKAARLQSGESTPAVGKPDIVDLEAEDIKAENEDIAAEEEHSNDGIALTPATSTSSPPYDHIEESGDEDNESGEGEGEEEEALDSSDSSASEVASSQVSYSADSDFSEEVEGQVWDGRNWCCEICNVILSDGECPNGHNTQRCEHCAWKLEDGSCPKCAPRCGSCGTEMLGAVCRHCGPLDYEEQADWITFDTFDGIWRCFDCSWEVEATSKWGGYCHCVNENNENRYLDLSEYPDFEPGEPCGTNEEESADEESDSEDERFIDDDEGDGMDDTVFDADSETLLLAGRVGTPYRAEIKGAIEEANARLAARYPQSSSGNEEGDDGVMEL